MRKQKPARLLPPEAVEPVIKFSNYTTVTPASKWGPRLIPDMELILVVEGRFRYEQKNQPAMIAHAGDVIIIPPDVEHVVCCDAGVLRSAFSCIHCELMKNATWAGGGYQPDPFPPAITETHMDKAIHDLFQRCSIEIQGATPHRDALLSTMVKEIWLRLARYWKHPQSAHSTRRMRDMLAFLREHAADGAGRAELARAFGLTPQHVNALFRTEQGITPGEFVRRERMLAAYRYLREEELSVKETAYRMGYDDPFYFSKVFKSVMGRSPSEVRWRRSHPS